MQCAILFFHFVSYSIPFHKMPCTTCCFYYLVLFILTLACVCTHALSFFFSLLQRREYAFLQPFGQNLKAKHTYTHSHIQVCVHTYTYIHSLTHTYACTHTLSHIHAHAEERIHSLTHKCACTHTHTHSRTHACT